MLDGSNMANSLKSKSIAFREAAWVARSEEDLMGGKKRLSNPWIDRHRIVQKMLQKCSKSISHSISSVFILVFGGFPDSPRNSCHVLAISQCSSLGELVEFPAERPSPLAMQRPAHCWRRVVSICGNWRIQSKMRSNNTTVFQRVEHKSDIPPFSWQRS